LVLRRNQKLEQRKNVLHTLPITKLPFVSKVVVIGIDKASCLCSPDSEAISCNLT
jgi:hypothetical protein